MSIPLTTLYNKAQNPIVQASLILGGVILTCIGAQLINRIGLIDLDERFAWQASTAFLLFFAVFNSVSTLVAKDLRKYRNKSMICFILLAVSTAWFAYLFSAIPIGEAGSYQWIYFVMIFGYLVFLSIVGLIKKIVDFAESEDWQEPKMKSRKRKP